MTIFLSSGFQNVRSGIQSKDQWSPKAPKKANRLQGSRVLGLQGFRDPILSGSWDPMFQSYTEDSKALGFWGSRTPGIGFLEP